ncbi:MAG TPA: CHAT domain-containing protein [Edaphobacter sp.]|nr:CHAT domain-containing protein [Edaphobacter sp.]
MREQHHPQWVARFRVEAAKIRQIQGQSDEVIRLLDRDWMPSSSGPDLTAQRLSLLSLAYARKGDSVRAAKAIDEADQLMAVSQSVRAEVLAARARFDLEEDNLIEARSLFQKSLAAARAGGNRFSETVALLNLSVINLQQDHYEDALEQSEAAARIANSIGAQLLLVKLRGTAGWAYYETGDYQRALANFNEASAEAAILGSTIDQEICTKNAGMSEARLGDLSAAQERYHRSLALARSLKNPAEITYVDQALASLLLHTSNPEAASPYIDEARKLAQQTGSSFDLQLGNLLEAQFLAQRGKLPEAEALLLEVEQQTHQFPTIRLDAQHTLAQVGEEVGDRKQAETWFQRSIATYHSQRSELRTDDARLPFSQNGQDLYMDYVDYLVRNHQTDEALNVIDQGRAETLAEGLGLENKDGTSTRPLRISLRTLARQSHAVILVYAMSEHVSYLWAANSKESGFYTLPDRASILAAAASHRRAVLSARDLMAELHPAGRDLYEMLVKPAENLIHHGDRVFVVAGDINGLNFETLLTAGQVSHYWIEDVAITHLASVRLLALAHRQLPVRGSAPQQGQLLVIGNPVYAGEQYTALPNAAAEVANVAAHFPDRTRTVLTGTNASPDAYIRSDPARFKYIHFVSHATASRLVPLDSAVILSARGTPDSAKLYARDILSKPLHAELVTISACQGSGVRVYAGEGLVGLAWAFLRAGSRNVIGALWDVSDASTPELMGHLYDGIAVGKSPDVSLRAAKLDMLHSHGVFRKPIYWGAFQLYSSGQ